MNRDSTKIQPTTRTLGELIQQARKDRHETVESLAAAARLDKGQLSRIINGQTSPKPGTVKAIATALELEFTDIPSEYLWPEAIDAMREMTSNSLYRSNVAFRRRVSLLIEYDPNQALGYCDRLRELIAKPLDAEFIKYSDPLLSSPSEDFKSAFRKAMRSFCSDKESGTLISVFPNEGPTRFDLSEISPWASSIKNYDKHVICIDSGYQLKKPNPPNGLPLLSPKYLTIIQAKHEAAMFSMLLRIFENLEEISSATRIDFLLTEADRQNPTLLMRKSQYSRFVTLLGTHIARFNDSKTSMTEDQKAAIAGDHYDAWRQIEGTISKRQLEVSVQRLSIPKWTRKAAREVSDALVQEVGAAMSIESRNRKSLKVFLCDNDDVALGVLDSITKQRNSDSPLPDRGALIVGFDGVPAFKQEFDESGMVGLTYKPDYSILDRIVKDYLREGIIPEREDDGSVWLDGELEWAGLRNET